MLCELAAAALEVKFAPLVWIRLPPRLPTEPALTVLPLAVMLAPDATVGILLQEPPLNEELDVRGNVDEAVKPLSVYRTEELARSHECFFGEDRSYHEARSAFVYKTGAPCKVVQPAADNEAMELLRSAVTQVAA